MLLMELPRLHVWFILGVLLLSGLAHAVDSENDDSEVGQHSQLLNIIFNLPCIKQFSFSRK